MCLPYDRLHLPTPNNSQFVVTCERRMYFNFQVTSSGQNMSSLKQCTFLIQAWFVAVDMCFPFFRAAVARQDKLSRLAHITLSESHSVPLGIVRIWNLINECKDIPPRNVTDSKTESWVRGFSFWQKCCITLLVLRQSLFHEVVRRPRNWMENGQAFRESKLASQRVTSQSCHFQTRYRKSPPSNVP